MTTDGCSRKGDESAPTGASLTQSCQPAISDTTHVSVKLASERSDYTEAMLRAYTEKAKQKEEQQGKRSQSDRKTEEAIDKVRGTAPQTPPETSELEHKPKVARPSLGQAEVEKAFPVVDGASQTKEPSQVAVRSAPTGASA